jgi:hypothetical protein
VHNTGAATRGPLPRWRGVKAATKEFKRREANDGAGGRSRFAGGPGVSVCSRRPGSHDRGLSKSSILFASWRSASARDGWSLCSLAHLVWFSFGMLAFKSALPTNKLWIPQARLQCPASVPASNPAAEIDLSQYSLRSNFGPPFNSIAVVRGVMT